MSDSKRQRAAQARAAAHQTRGWVHRRRFGWPGTEPPEGRNQVRHWGSLGLAVVAGFLGIIDLAVVAAIVAAASFVLGAPRAWTWRNDRLSSLSWAVAVVAVVVGVILYLAGDNTIHHTHSGRQPGTASLVIAFGALEACLGYYRRWGTAGNQAYWDLQMRKRDPVAAQAGRERAQRSGADRRWQERERQRDEDSAP